jgi:hypothetical protein
MARQQFASKAGRAHMYGRSFIPGSRSHVWASPHLVSGPIRHRQTFLCGWNRHANLLVSTKSVPSGS